MRWASSTPISTCFQNYHSSTSNFEAREIGGALYTRNSITGTRAMQKINIEETRQRLENSQQLSGCGNGAEKLTESYHSKVMLRLWVFMSELYGYKFISQFGEEPSDVWTRTLSDLSAEEIKTGIDSLEKRSDEFPPGAIEFKKLCKGSQSPDGINPLAYQQHPALSAPKPERDEDYGRRMLDQIRQQVGLHG